MTAREHQSQPDKNTNDTSCEVWSPAYQSNPEKKQEQPANAIPFGRKVQDNFGRRRLSSIVACHELANPADLSLGDSVNAANSLGLYRRHAQPRRARDNLYD